MIRRPPRSTRTDTLFPYTTPFRSQREAEKKAGPAVISLLNRGRLEQIRCTPRHDPNLDDYGQYQRRRDRRRRDREDPAKKVEVMSIDNGDDRHQQEHAGEQKLRQPPIIAPGPFSEPHALAAPCPPDGQRAEDDRR